MKSVTNFITKPSIALSARLLSAVCALLIFCSTLHAADGDLDTTFGTGGIVTTAFTSGSDYANSCPSDKRYIIDIMGIITHFFLDKIFHVCYK